MRILVTRPEPGLSKTVSELQTLGKKAFAAPMLKIESVPPVKKMAADIFLVTSAHALPALENQERSCRILTVGQVTAQQALKMGFTQVSAAEGNAEALGKLFLEKNYAPENAYMAAGKGNDGKLYGDFLVQNLGIKRFEAYKVSWTSHLSETAQSFLKENGQRQILFYSSETARSFLNLLNRAEQKEDFSVKKSQIEILCFSKAIAEIFKKRPDSPQWAKIEESLASIFQNT